MDAAVIAERQEADGLARQAQRDFPDLSFPAGGRGDRQDQSDPTRLGEVLRDRPLESVFLLYPKLGKTKIRRHLARACQRRGLGWKRWSREWLDGTLGLFSEYRVSYLLGSRSSLIGPITFDVKCAGARSAGNPHATRDVAGAGNQFTVRLVRHSQRKRGAIDRPDLRSHGTSPDPTGMAGVRNVVSLPRRGMEHQSYRFVRFA